MIRNAKKSSHFNGFRSYGFEEYGLKAARRAPQFSKR